MDAGTGVVLMASGHSWSQISSTADYVRAGLWCLSNLTIGVSYLLLPIEIWHWRLALPLRSTALIGTLFASFIAFCGLSHLTMIVIMPIAPWWATMVIFVPTAAISLVTVLVLRKERRLILAALRGVKTALTRSMD